MKRIDAYFYAAPSGEEPVRAWLKELPPVDRRTIGVDIQKVEFGWPIGLPVCRSLGEGLWEVRSNLASRRIARVIFAVKADRMVLLNGFIKKTQKTPSREIKLAKTRLNSLV